MCELLGSFSWQLPSTCSFHKNSFVLFFLFCLALCSSTCASWYSGKDSVDLKWFLKLYFWIPFSLVLCLTSFHQFSFLVFSTLPTQLSKTIDLTGSSFLLRLWPRNCLQAESQSSLSLLYLFPFSQGKQPYTTCGPVSENSCFIYLSSL